MNMQMQADIGLLYFVTELKLFFSIALVLNMFLKKFVGNENIKANIFRVQANDSVMYGYFCIVLIGFMLAGKKLTDFTNMFSPYDFKKNDDIILSYVSDEQKKVILSKQLTEQTKFRLDELIKIENYLHEEINQRKLQSKKLSKYVVAFDYIDKILIVLSATTGGVSICLFMSVVGAPVGIASASFTLILSLTTGIVKVLLSTTRNRNKKLDKIFMFAKSKLNSIKTLISQAMLDMEICHKEFVMILKEKDKYKKMKENLRGENEKQEIMRLSSIKPKI